jgi:GNAT superfamily N-acetyltransferase
VPRVAGLADLPSIRRLNAAAYAVYLHRMNRPPAPVTHDYTAEVQAGQVWLIGGSGQPGGEVPPAGLIVLIPAADCLLIENIAVAPSAQRRGLGRRLMEFAEQRAADLGLHRLTLYTNEVMVENIAIYARLGYRETERRSEHGYDRVFMEKRLPTCPASA